MKSFKLVFIARFFYIIQILNNHKFINYWTILKLICKLVATMTIFNFWLSKFITFSIFNDYAKKYSYHIHMQVNSFKPSPYMINLKYVCTNIDLTITTILQNYHFDTKIGWVIMTLIWVINPLKICILKNNFRHLNELCDFEVIF